jgi:hypothetical protein
LSIIGEIAKLDNVGLIEKKNCLSMHDLTKIHVILILVDGQKCHLQSNVLRSNVTCGQMSRGQMSLAVKCPTVKCHCGQMSLAVKCHCGQMSRGQMSLAVKCPAVKCHLRSNVPRSNVTVVQCHKILKWSKVRGQMFRVRSFK